MSALLKIVNKTQQADQKSLFTYTSNSKGHFQTHKKSVHEGGPTAPMNIRQLKLLLYRGM